ncbi:MAG: polysaccharide pyruvyl transferase family protein [Prevotella sp.]|nr:polysaccharide pyruvyl transferase family protein [Prevotella sp.]
MKIGILTLPLHTNYGGILQAYALQTVLERMGHEVIVLNRDRSIYSPKHKQILSYIVYLIKKYCLGRKVSPFKSAKRKNIEREEREQYTSVFINKYIHTYVVKKIDKDMPKNVDAFVVGSDQVWRHKYFTRLFKSRIENAYLKFSEGENVKRIAYAASFGTEEWEYSEAETKECARLLALFDAVSVREESGVILCAEQLARNDAKHVLDPTMLLSKDDYIKIVEDTETPKSSGNLMCYVLDDNANIQALINRIALEKSLTPFIANSKVSDKKLPNKERIQPPVERWLRGFMDAEFVVTDSFHACVFSILFHKPFVVIGNKKRGCSRFESLLKMFGLENRLIENASQFDISMLNPISDDAYRKLDEYKMNSMEFLNNALTD